MKSAILFIVFNRPDTTAKVFEAIRDAKPPRLYIAADGPRLSRLDESEKCKDVRKIVSNIDWPCDVKTLLRDKNLGCKLGVSSGIDWFFQNEKEGIILEDDVVPHPDFFIFCDSMLLKYRNDERVMMVSGTNYNSSPDLQWPYFFSECYSIWGWATWRRAWSKYDVDMKAWDSAEAKKNIAYKFQYGYIWKHFKNTFDSLRKDYIDTWDIQWVFACIYNHGLAVVPRVNLIANIGVDGTHSSSVTDSHYLEVESLYTTNFNDSETIPVVVYADYDNKLHKQKSLPAIRQRNFISLLNSLRIYYLLRFIYRLLKRQRKISK